MQSGMENFVIKLEITQ